MNSPPKFAFESASTSNELMSELEKFLVFWLGPWNSAFGEPESTLRSQRLPKPLRRLYAFAGKWKCTEERGTEMRALNCGEGLRLLEQLDRTWLDSIYFADECQMNWSCSTRRRGADPAVWVKDNCGMDFYQWRCVDRSLSRFLVTLCLRELMGTSRFMRFDQRLEKWFRESMHKAVPLWSNHPFPYCPEGYSFYLIGDSVLVGDFRHDGMAFAASKDEGIELLKQQLI